MKNLKLAAIFVSILLIIGLVIIGCSGGGGFAGGDSSKGSFSIGVIDSRSTSRNIEDEPLPPLIYVISLNGPGPSQEQEISDHSSTAFFSVIPGTWTITVNAFLAENREHFGYGSVTKNIVAGHNPTIVVEMERGGPDRPTWDIEVTTWAELKTQIESASEDLAILLNEVAFVADRNISVQSGRQITLIAEKMVVVFNDTPNQFAEPFFTIEGALTLGHSGMSGEIVLTRNDDQFAEELINVNTGGELVLNNKVTLTGNDRSGTPPSLPIRRGGAVVVDGTFNMYGGTISGNRANNGGGVYVSESGQFYMFGGDISNNEAVLITAIGYEGTGFGGGVFVDLGGTFKKSLGGTISNNTAEGAASEYHIGSGLPGRQVCVVEYYSCPSTFYLGRNSDVGSNDNLDSSNNTSAGGWE